MTGDGRNDDGSDGVGSCEDRNSADGAPDGPRAGARAGVTDPSYAEWRAALEEGTLLGQRCADCGHETAAPKAACAQCGSRDIVRIELPTEGEVYARTHVAVAPSEFDGPYDVGLVIVGDARVLARLESDFEIGETVSFQGVFDGPRGPAPVFG